MKYTIENFKKRKFEILINDINDYEKVRSLLEINEIKKWGAGERLSEFIPSDFPFYLVSNITRNRLLFGTDMDMTEHLISTNAFIRHNRGFNGIRIRLSNDKLIGYFMKDKMISKVSKIDRNENSDIKTQVHKLVDKLFDDIGEEEIWKIYIP